MILAIVILLAWIALNIAAPFAILLGAQRVARGRLPAELLAWDSDAEVRFYVSTLRAGYGFSLWAPPWSVIVFDREFFRHAGSDLIRFVIAHELAHFTLGHHKFRWFSVVTGIVLFPAVRRKLRRMEDEADAVATIKTGFNRAQFVELN